MISDGIILSGIFVFIFEVLFILSRINGLWGFFTGESWIEQKLFAGFVSLFIVLVLYGGYTYMNARGEEEKVKKGIATIRMAIIGLIVVLGAYAIWFYIYEKFIL